MTKNLVPEFREYNSPVGLRIVDVRSAHDLARHADAWADLMLQSSATSPMLSYPQISAFFETQIRPSETWLCLLAFQEDVLIAVFPLIAVRSFGVLGCSILCFKTPYDGLHTSGVDCLTLNGREEILEVFADYLSSIPGTWPLIRLRELPENSPSILHLSRQGTRFRSVRKVSASENYIQISPDNGDFHAGLSSNFRRQLKRGGRKLHELENVRFHCREGMRSLAENMRRFEDLEDAGWKGARNSSIKAVVGNSQLYATAADRFKNYGWMEWNFLEVGDKTIGAHYAVRINRTLYLLKICYDEEYADCSPGNLLLEKVIEHACNAGDVDEINCVADCAWHRNWGMKKRLLYDLIILPKVPFISNLIARILNSKSFRRYSNSIDQLSP